MSQRSIQTSERGQKPASTPGRRSEQGTREVVEIAKTVYDLFSRRSLWNQIQEIRLSPSATGRRADPRVKLQACGLAFKLRASLICSMATRKLPDSRIEWQIDGKGVDSMDQFLSQRLHACLLIASKTLEKRAISINSIAKAPCFQGADGAVGARPLVAQVAKVEMDVLMRLHYGIGRQDSMVARFCSRDDETMQDRILDILHLHCCDPRAYLFKDVQVPLLGCGVFAAAFAIVRRQAPGALLYALTAQRLERPFWDISELQLVTNAILDNIIEAAAPLRYNLLEASDHVLST